MSDYERLCELVGHEFDYLDVECAMNDYELAVLWSNTTVRFEDYDVYEVYYDAEMDIGHYLIKVSREENIIVEIEEISLL